METYRAIMTLRSVRHFIDKPLPDAVLHRILEAGRWTGSAKNVQPWQFIVVRNRDTLNKLAACGKFASHLRGAAAAIVVASQPGWSGTFDTGRVVQNVMLAAWDEGIGSCIASMHDADAARTILGAPLECQVVAISLGYPLPNAPQTIEGRPREQVLASVGRRPLDEMVHEEKW
jgi:nitroreductase